MFLFWFYRYPNARVVRALKHKCLGKQRCVVGDFEAEIRRDDGHDTQTLCRGRYMQSSAIVTCRKAQLPAGSSDLPQFYRFGVAHFETRRLDTQTSAALSLTSAFQLRAAFQGSRKIVRAGVVPKTTGVVWARANRAGGGAARHVHRLMAQFTLGKPEGEYEKGVDLWRMRVKGREFWKLGKERGRWRRRCSHHHGLTFTQHCGCCSGWCASFNQFNKSFKYICILLGGKN